MPVSSWNRRYPNLGRINISSYDTSDSDQNDGNIHEFDEFDNYNNASDIADDEDSMISSEIPSTANPHAWNLLIHNVLSNCQLSNEQTTKVYALIRFLTSSKPVSLPKNFKDLLSIHQDFQIHTWKQIYCDSSNTFTDDFNHTCNGKHGTMHVFDLSDTLRSIISRNMDSFMHGLNRHDSLLASSFYKRIWSETQQNSSDFRITLMINNDDAKITKSTRDFITPISFCIAELPIHLRYKEENVGLIALYCGKAKPDHDDVWQNSFINQYRSNQHEVLEIMYENVSWTFEIKLGLIIMDAVAKAKSLNIKQFNGYFGCPYCLHRGESVTTRANTRKHVYKYINSSDFIMRTSQSYMDYARRAVIRQRPYRGIKGPTVLSSIMDVPSQTPIDWMHCILIGVFKILLQHKPFSDRTVKETTSDHLRKIAFPHDFKRRPETLHELANFKAHVFKSWLFLLPPIFHGCIPADHLALILILSFGIKLLCRNSLTMHDIEKSQIILDIFASAHQQVYQLESMNPNIHFMQHIPSMADDIGCLQNFSAFVYESFIYQLKKNMHGTRGFSNQIVKAYLERKRKAHLVSASRFYQIPGIPKELQVHTCNSSVFIDNLEQTPINDVHVLRLLRNANVTEFNSGIYLKTQRLRIRSEVFHSESYRRKRKSVSFHVSYFGNDHSVHFGKILFFVVAAKDDQIINDAYALINEYKIYQTNNFFIHEKPTNDILKMLVTRHEHHHFKKITCTNKRCLVPVTKILHKIVLIPIPNSENTFWCSEIDYEFEHD